MFSLEEEMNKLEQPNSFNLEQEMNNVPTNSFSLEAKMNKIPVTKKTIIQNQQKAVLTKPQQLNNITPQSLQNEQGQFDLSQLEKSEDGGEPIYYDGTMPLMGSAVENVQRQRDLLDITKDAINQYPAWVSNRGNKPLDIFPNAGKDALEIVGGLAQLAGMGISKGIVEPVIRAVDPNQPFITENGKNFGKSLVNDFKDLGNNFMKSKGLTDPEFWNQQRRNTYKNHPELMMLKNGLVQGLKEQYGQEGRDLSKEGIDWGKFAYSFHQHPMNLLDIVGLGEVGKIGGIGSKIAKASNKSRYLNEHAKDLLRAEQATQEINKIKNPTQEQIAEFRKNIENKNHRYTENGLEKKVGNEYVPVDETTGNLVGLLADRLITSPKIQNGIDKLSNTKLGKFIDNTVGKTLADFGGLKSNHPLLSKNVADYRKLQELSDKKTKKIRQEIANSKIENEIFSDMTEEQGKKLVKEIEYDDANKAFNEIKDKPDVNTPNPTEPAVKSPDNMPKMNVKIFDENNNPDFFKNLAEQEAREAGETPVAKATPETKKSIADKLDETDINIRAKEIRDAFNRGEIPADEMKSKLKELGIESGEKRETIPQNSAVGKPMPEQTPEKININDDTKRIIEANRKDVSLEEIIKQEKKQLTDEYNIKAQEKRDRISNIETKVKELQNAKNTATKDGNIGLAQDYKKQISDLNREKLKLKNSLKPNSVEHRKFLKEIKKLDDKINNISKNDSPRFNANRTEREAIFDKLVKGEITFEEFDKQIAELSKGKKQVKDIQPTSEKDIVSDSAKEELDHVGVKKSEYFPDGLTDGDYQLFKFTKDFRDSDNVDDVLKLKKLLMNSSLSKHPDFKKFIDFLDDDDIKLLDSSEYANKKANSLFLPKTLDVFIRRNIINGNGKRFKRGEFLANALHELAHKYNQKYHPERVLDEFNNSSGFYSEQLEELDIIKECPTLVKDGEKWYNYDGNLYKEKDVIKVYDDYTFKYENHPDEVFARKIENDFFDFYNNAKKEYVKKRDINYEKQTTQDADIRATDKRLGNEVSEESGKRNERKSKPDKEQDKPRYKATKELTDFYSKAKEKFVNKLKENSVFWKSKDLVTDDIENANIIDTYACYKFGKTKRSELTEHEKIQAQMEINRLPDDKKPFYVPRIFNENLVKSDFNPTRRSDLTNINELKRRTYAGREDSIMDGKFTRVYSPEEIANRIDAHRIKLQNTEKYIDDVTETFAEPLEAGAKVKDGYVEFNPEVIKAVFIKGNDFADAMTESLKAGNKVDDALKSAIEGSKGDFEKAFVDFIKELQDNSPKYQIKKSILDDLKNSVTYRHENENVALVSSLWDIGTNVFKTKVLGLNPKWFINNRIGNTIMAAFKGTNIVNPRLLSKVNKLSDNLFPEEILGSTFINSEHPIKLPTTGTELDPYIQLLSGTSIKDANKLVNSLSIPGKAINGISKRVFDVNQKFETMDRKMVYLKNLEKNKKEIIKNAGITIQTTEDLLKYAKNTPDVRNKLLEAVNDVLGDYSTMSHRERTILKRICPFYSWLRTISRHTASLPKTNPIRTAIYTKLARLSAYENDDLPDYQKYAVKTGYKTKKGNNKTVLNYEHSIPYSTFAETGDNPISLFNPAIQNLDRLLGVKSYNGMPLVSKKYAKTGQGGYVNLDDKEGEVKNLPMSERAKAYGLSLLRNIPLVEGTEKASGILFGKEHRPYDKVWDTNFGGYYEGEGDTKGATGFTMPEKLVRTVLPLQKQGKITTNKTPHRYKKHRRMLKNNNL